MPDGKYLVLLKTVRPRLVRPGEGGDYFKEEQIDLWGIDGFWGMPHFPKTEYYRLLTKTMKEGRGLFEFLIPIFPHGWLNEQRLSEYETTLNKGAMPTAVAISVLDVKAPADWDEEQNITSHWCLGHYLVDGHHKVYAAAMNNKPLTLVSFLAIEQGISSEEEINELGSSGDRGVRGTGYAIILATFIGPPHQPLPKKIYQFDKLNQIG